MFRYSTKEVFLTKTIYLDDSIYTKEEITDEYVLEALKEKADFGWKFVSSITFGDKAILIFEKPDN